MHDNPSAQLDAEDHALLEQARLESEAADAAALAVALAADGGQPQAVAPAQPEMTPQAAPIAQAPAAPAPTPAQAPAAQAPAAPAAAPTAAAPTPAAPAAPTQQPTGDPRAALRAARAAEQRALKAAAAVKSENERLQAELADLRQKAGIKSEGEMTAQQLEDLKEYAPAAYATYMAAQEKLKSLTPAPAAAPAAQDFTPDTFDDYLQDAIDDVPVVQAWQYDRTKQTEWAAVKAADGFLSKLPGWSVPANATPEQRHEILVKRFNQAAAEVLSRYNATPPAPPTPAQLAAARIAQAPVGAAPVTAGNLRGGESPANVFPNYHQMTDEQIMASLPHV